MTMQLVNEAPIGFWVYDIRPSLFRKRPVVQSDMFQGNYEIVAIKRRWANGEALTVTHTTDVLLDPQDFLDAGKAVFDHRSRTMLMPGDTFPPLA